MDKKTIVCLGDSITFGYLNTKTSWVSILDNSFEDATFINKGINGDTTTGMLLRFEEDVISNKPDTVIFLGGVNDISNAIGLATIKNNVKEIHKLSKENNINLIILTLLPAPILYTEESDNFDNILDKNFKEYNNFLIEYSKENNIKYIDTYTIMNSIIEKEDNIYSDGLHLTKKGNQVLATELKNILTKEGII